jgi:hypothetical protein
MTEGLWLPGSLYTREVREFIRSRDWPKGLILEIIEEEEPAPHLKIILFRDNWITLPREAHHQATAVVKEVMEKLRADGIPIYMDRIRSSVNERGGLVT